MLSKTTSLLPDALFASLGMPRTIESIKEAKTVSDSPFVGFAFLNHVNFQGIDHELRRSCEAIISYCSNPVARPLTEWTDRVYAQSTEGASLSEKSRTPGTSSVELGISPSLLQQDWISEGAVGSLDHNARRMCETELRSAVIRLRLYLEDDRTVRVLVEHVQDSVMEAYGRFRGVVTKLYASGVANELLGVTELRALLGDVCQG
jgi:conserved oligomeric Golgi complex subunit 3